MKVDGKEIARQNMARKKENDELKSGGEDIKNEIESRGDHIAHMFSMIEAIHAKDPEMAHKHMMAYAESASKK
jgi:DNA-binding GntR family transcriptional regulator